MGDGMKERPIFMAPENAQKCHEGTKTQTRRIVSVPSWASDDDMLKLAIQRPATGIAYYMDGIPEKRLTCPYGVVGDRLWVREPWAWPGEEFHLYKGSPADARIVEEWKKDQNSCQVKWTPSIHMPRFACRTVLEITEIRVERLKEISEEDALAEIGSLETVTQEWVDDCEPGTQAHKLATLLVGKQIRAKLSFMNLWISSNGEESWRSNPWVWVIAFRKVGACER